MDFFAAQDEARERTGRLLWLFALAVTSVVLSVHIAVELFLGWSGNAEFEFHPHWDLLPWTAGVTLVPMGIVALTKWAALSGGGGAVAEALGGRRLPPDASDYQERQLLNVVEEVSIAAGLRVPEVWVLDEEPGINAFAAGADPSSAAIAVSRGCLERLSRDELQGVVGHECSHILNGDMRLNFHTMAWIAGIAALFVLGQVLVRLTPHFFAGGNRSSSRKKQEENGLVFLLLVAGLVLLIAGSVGAFFARLIQAAISRQREFLADASAVQFTRNPEGICNALKKIGGYVDGSRLHSVRSTEVAHMLFCDGAAGFFSSFFATHPPLSERIHRLEPAWHGAVSDASAETLEPGVAEETHANALTGTDGFKSESTAPVGSGEDWMALARNAETSGHVLMALLEAFEDESGSDALNGLASYSTLERMTLLDLALSAARQLPKPEVRKLLEDCEQQVIADESYNLFEMMLLQSIRRHLGVASGLRAPAAVCYADGMSLRGAFQVVLSAMAVLGTDHEANRDASFATAWEALDLGEAPRLDVAQIPVSVIEEALFECEKGTAVLRGSLLRSCVLAVEMDGVMTELEAGLLRAVADALGLPAPDWKTGLASPVEEVNNGR